MKPIPLHDFLVIKMQPITTIANLVVVRNEEKQQDPLAIGEVIAIGPAVNQPVTAYAKMAALEAVKTGVPIPEFETNIKPHDLVVYNAFSAIRAPMYGKDMYFIQIGNVWARAEVETGESAFPEQTKESEN